MENMDLTVGCFLSLVFLYLYSFVCILEPGMLVSIFYPRLFVMHLLCSCNDGLLSF